MIRLIASDLDGTLLNDERQISDFTKKIIDKATAGGVYFIPVSARTWREIPEWLKSNESIPYIVCENGTVVVDNQKKEVISEIFMSEAKVVEVLLALEEVNPYWTINIREETYSNQRIIKDAEKLGIDPGFLDKIKESRIITNDYQSLIAGSGGLSKIHFSIGDDCCRQKTYQILGEIADIAMSSSHPRNVEVTSNLASKALGLELVGKLLQIEAAEMASFGDNDNDLPMLKYTGKSYTPLNGIEIVKKQIKVLPHSNNEDAVAHKISEFMQQI